MLSAIESEYYTVEQLTKLLHIGRNTAYDLIHYKMVETFKIGRRYMISQASVNEMLRKLPQHGSLGKMILESKSLCGEQKFCMRKAAV